jgi:hypothetical protein
VQRRSGQIIVGNQVVAFNRRVEVVIVLHSFGRRSLASAAEWRSALLSGDRDQDVEHVLNAWLAEGYFGRERTGWLRQVLRDRLGK